MWGKVRDGYVWWKTMEQSGAGQSKAGECWATHFIIIHWKRVIREEMESSYMHVPESLLPLEHGLLCHHVGHYIAYEASSKVVVGKINNIILKKSWRKRKRERDRVCVFDRERGRERVWEREIASERKSVCVRKREIVNKRESDRLCMRVCRRGREKKEK